MKRIFVIVIMAIGLAGCQGGIAKFQQVSGIVTTATVPAETAQIAINSALTGHLVFTTVHANNVLDVLGRFLNMGVEPYNFVSALNCILAQRLVRTLCVYALRGNSRQQIFQRKSIPDFQPTCRPNIWRLRRRLTA